MTLWAAAVREPVLARRFMVAVLAGAAVCVATVQVGRSFSADSPVARTAWPLAFVTLAGAAVVAWVAMFAAMRATHTYRPAFMVARGRFLAPPAAPVALLVAMQAPIFAMTFGTSSPRMFTESSSLEDIVLNVVWWTTLALSIVLLVAMSGIAWVGDVGVSLTREGVVDRNPVFRRTIPWDAIVAAGVARPSPNDTTLALTVDRPELVAQRGLPVMAGTVSRPRVSLNVATHPWFLADAIRWYAEHPEHRAAIGTRVEYDRLLTALGGQAGPR